MVNLVIIIDNYEIPNDCLEQNIHQGVRSIKKCFQTILHPAPKMSSFCEFLSICAIMVIVRHNGFDSGYVPVNEHLARLRVGVQTARPA